MDLQTPSTFTSMELESKWRACRKVLYGRVYRRQMFLRSSPSIGPRRCVSAVRRVCLSFPDHIRQTETYLVHLYLHTSYDALYCMNRFTPCASPHAKYAGGPGREMAGVLCDARLPVSFNRNSMRIPHRATMLEVYPPRRSSGVLGTTIQLALAGALCREPNFAQVC